MSKGSRQYRNCGSPFLNQLQSQIKQSNQFHDPETKRGKRPTHSLHHSGKKKKHTVQNRITANLNGEAIHRPAHSPGSHHDYKIYKSKHPVLSEELLQSYDLGYLGLVKTLKTKPALYHTRKRDEKDRCCSKGMEQTAIKNHNQSCACCCPNQEIRINSDDLGTDCAIMTEPVGLPVAWPVSGCGGKTGLS